MLPVIALVGRPNVGKSTLFNYLTRTRDALVTALPGLTRDRQYGYGRVGPTRYIVVDTGGLTGEADGIEGLMQRQTRRALEEADVVLFLVDGRAGLTPADEDVARLLRTEAREVRLVVNKSEGQQGELIGAEFHALGLGEPACVSAAHGHNIIDLMDQVLEPLSDETAGSPEQDETGGIKVAVIGRPNVGKSTLINRIIGEDRVVTFDEPGTTRDSVFVPFSRDGQDYTLIDTAGVRRRARVKEVIEKFSVIKTLQAIDQANVVIAVLDAHENVAEQDATLLGMAVERGRALVLAVNKWDGLSRDQRDDVRRQLDLRLPFTGFARLHFISALHGTGVGDLLESVNQAYAAAMRDLPTPALTRVLESAVQAHQPPLVRGRRIKLRYAHQGGKNPPVIVVHGNQTGRLPDTYRRYLASKFRNAFELAGTPVRIDLRTGTNPYEGRRNRLTPRQERKRKRLKRHVKRNK